MFFAFFELLFRSKQKIEENTKEEHYKTHTKVMLERITLYYLYSLHSVLELLAKHPLQV